MIPSDIRETQALALLEAADTYRGYLLPLAYKLCGGDEERGMDLYQQTLLNCHDAIQRNGFVGDKYQFYLYRSLKNLFHKEGRRRSREVSVDFQSVESSSAGRDDEGHAPWAAKASRNLDSTGLNPSKLSASPDSDPATELAEQVMAEVREKFSFADRIALRLHIDGFSFREIALHLGRGEQTQFFRRVEKIKAALRKTFQQAYDSLSDPEY